MESSYTIPFAAQVDLTYLTTLPDPAINWSELLSPLPIPTPIASSTSVMPVRDKHGEESASSCLSQQSRDKVGSLYTTQPATFICASIFYCGDGLVELAEKNFRYGPWLSGNAVPAPIDLNTT